MGMVIREGKTYRGENNRQDGGKGQAQLYLQLISRLHPLSPAFKALVIYPMPIEEMQVVFQLFLKKMVSIKNRYDLGLQLNRGMSRCAFFLLPGLNFLEDLLGIGGNEEEEQ